MLTTVHFRIFCFTLSEHLRIKIYKTIILPVIFMWVWDLVCLTSREEQRLRVFGNWVLKRICIPKTEKIAGGRRRLHNKKLYNLNASLNIIWFIKSRRIKWVGIWHAWESWQTHTKFYLKTWRGRPLRRCRHRQEDNIRMNLGNIGWEGMS
jgi:hypothetical protein